MVSVAVKAPGACFVQLLLPSVPAAPSPGLLVPLPLSTAGVTPGLQSSTVSPARRSRSLAWPVCAQAAC